MSDYEKSSVLTYPFNFINRQSIHKTNCVQRIKKILMREVFPAIALKLMVRKYYNSTLKSFPIQTYHAMQCFYFVVFTAPSVMEVFIKGGTGLHRESNLHSLRRYGLDPDDEDKIMDDLVIVECSDWHRDRKFNAFCILQYSATANGMLLQWSCSNIQNNYKPNYKNEKKPMEKMK